jgi:hypothetical protein
MNRGMALLAWAWVLWKQSIVMAPVIAPGTQPLERVVVTWQRHGAYETQEACEEAAKVTSGGKLICLPESGTPGTGESAYFQSPRGGATGQPQGGATGQPQGGATGHPQGGATRP